MNFSLEKSIQILERTPTVLEVMLKNISPDWINNSKGEGTWSAYDVVGHLIHGEKTDWVPRAEIILSDKADKRFEKFDRFAQFENSKGKLLGELLEEFTALRKNNIDRLKSLNITDKDLDKKGIHPAFGDVTLAQLLSTWVVHDLNHIAQISRVMAKHYKEDVGPWTAYLKILQ
jgi:NTP pyrophosphatase (non-canonical NTP hydrolase)